LQLLGFALQHFLLPPLLEALRGVVALLGGELLLSARQLVEFFQRVIDVLRALIRRGRGLLRLVLVFLRVEFEIAEAREIPAGPPPARPARRRQAPFQSAEPSLPPGPGRPALSFLQERRPATSAAGAGRPPVSSRRRPPTFPSGTS